MHKLSKDKSKKAELKRAKRDAMKLLRSRRFFNEFLNALKKEGLVGEEQNALVLLIVVVSRLLRRPLHVYIKARSSAGKNFLATRVLDLAPKHAVAEITSVSDKAWNYLPRRFRHTVIYLQEENEKSGDMDPLRQLISEGKLMRLVTGWHGKKRSTEKHVARGPVASISTSTKNRLQLDDENRRISIRVNESREQTRQIVKSSARPSSGLSRPERRAWHMAHRLLEERIGAEIAFPKWFDEIAERVSVDDLRVRRYYPAFLEACRTVCLIRSFQKDHER